MPRNYPVYVLRISGGPSSAAPATGTPIDHGDPDFRHTFFNSSNLITDELPPETRCKGVWASQCL